MRCVRRRTIVLLLLTIPLLQAGTCAQIVARTAINGFFEGIAPVLLGAVGDARDESASGAQVP